MVQIFSKAAQISTDNFFYKSGNFILNRSIMHPCVRISKIYGKGFSLVIRFTAF